MMKNRKMIIKKRVGIAALFMFVMYLFSSCEKEVVEEKREGNFGLVYESTTKDGTKTTVDGTAIAWRDGDRVSINGIPYPIIDSRVDYDNSENGCLVWYPTALSTMSSPLYSSPFITNMTLPSEYTYTAENGRQVLDAPMVGKAIAGSKRVIMRPLTACICVVITNQEGEPLRLDKISITSDGSRLCMPTESTLNIGTCESENFTINAEGGNATNRMVSMLFSGVSLPANGGSIQVQIPILPVANTSLTIMAQGKYVGSQTNVRVARTTNRKNIARRKLLTANMGDFYISRDSDSDYEVEVYPDDCLKGMYEVAQGKYVFFSKGNLRWNPISGYSFCDYQYEYSFSPLTGTSYTSDPTALFNNRTDLYLYHYGWTAGAGYGTSTTSTAASYKYPWYRFNPSNMSSLTSKYGLDTWGTNANISPNTGTSMSGTEIYDWGYAYNQQHDISRPIGGGGFRTLTKDEYDYLLFSRSTDVTLGSVNNARYCKVRISFPTIAFSGGGSVSSAEGLILFPNNMSVNSIIQGISWGNKCNLTTAKFTDLAITYEQWQALEEAGCVFLPKAGRIFSATIYADLAYWTSTAYGNGYAYFVYGPTPTASSSPTTYTLTIQQIYRNTSSCVRLVRDDI